MFYFCSRIFLTEMQKNMIIEQTEDGIPTLYLPRMDEHYHYVAQPLDKGVKGLWRKLGMYTSTLHCELLGKKKSMSLK